MTRKSSANGSLRKILMTAAVIGVGGSLAGIGAYSAFTATTTNSGNTISAGTVSISDSDGGSAQLYNLSAQAPGSPQAKCIRVTYGGSITASAVKLYVDSVANGVNYSLTVERGSGITAPAADMNCTGFTSSSTVFNNTLNNFPTSYATGIDESSATTWSTSATVDYRFTISVVDDSTPNAHTSSNSTGAHTFTWEARS